MFAKQLVFSKKRNFGTGIWYYFTIREDELLLSVGCFAVGFRYFSVSDMHFGYVTLPSVCASLCISSSLNFRPVILLSAKGTHSIELRQLLEFL